MSPRSPRRPQPPPPPRAPRIKPVRLQPMRSAESIELDEATTKRRDRIPPFVRWDYFVRTWQWKEGEHITTIGPTGSGKTVLNRELLKHAPRKQNAGPWVVVFGIKNRDPELYAAFQREGYELVRRFDPEPPDDVDSARILFVPRTDKRGAEGEAVRAKAFRSALHDVEDTGMWTV